jgi:hypothetical protein
MKELKYTYKILVDKSEGKGHMVNCMEIVHKSNRKETDLRPWIEFV